MNNKLNKIERLKKELLPADFNIESVDWKNPDENIRFYLKNYGIYNIKLRPEVWMIRIRVDGGRISAKEIEKIAQIAKEESLPIILTARSQIELHNISPNRVYPIWKELNQAGLKSFQTLTDNFRAIVTDPLDSIAKDNKIDSFPIIQKIQESFISKREWMGTIPRKFNTAIIGRETPSFNPWGNDLLFALSKKDNIYGFNVYIGGKNSETAKSANIFCKAEDSHTLFFAIAKSYKKYGLRGSRAKTRLFHLLQEIGIDNFRDKIEKEYEFKLESEGDLLLKSSNENLDYQLNIEKFGTRGEISSTELLYISERAKKDNLTIRLTPNQELWLFNKIKLYIDKNTQYKKEGNITACAGERYCPLSLWDIKRDSYKINLDILTKKGISVGFSGCLKGCGRHHHSDIGLVGLRSNAFAPTERAIRVFIGAVQSRQPARLLFYAVPEREIERLFRVIAEDFEKSGFNTFEEFSLNILNRYSIETVMIWYLLRQLRQIPEDIYKIFLSVDEKSLYNEWEKLDIYPKENRNTQEIVSILSHKVWDID